MERLHTCARIGDKPNTGAVILDYPPTLLPGAGAGGGKVPGLSEVMAARCTNAVDNPKSVHLFEEGYFPLVDHGIRKACISRVVTTDTTGIPPLKCALCFPPPEKIATRDGLVQAVTGYGVVRASPSKVASPHTVRMVGIRPGIHQKPPSPIAEHDAERIGMAVRSQAQVAERAAIKQKLCTGKGQEEISTVPERAGGRLFPFDCGLEIPPPLTEEPKCLFILLSSRRQQVRPPKATTCGRKEGPEGAVGRVIGESDNVTVIVIAYLWHLTLIIDDRRNKVRH